MHRSEYLSNLAMAQAHGARVEAARKLAQRPHQAPRKAASTRVNWWPLVGFSVAFLWVFLLPLVAYLRG